MFLNKALTLTFLLIAFNVSSIDSTPVFCVDNVMCIRGDVWDSTQCKCVPKTTKKTTTIHFCPFKANCAKGKQWNQKTCKCV